MWYNNPSNLFTAQNYYIFFPTREMTLDEQLDTFIRFSIYLAIILYFINNDYRVIYIPVVIAIITLGIYASQSRKREELKELEDTALVKMRGKTCMRPSSQNPFMNPLVTDFAPDSKWQGANGGCDIENPQIKEDVFQKYSEKLYRSIGDVFNRNTGDRQFYQMPNTDIVNDQGGFAKWLYDRPNCKSGAIDKCYNDAVSRSYSMGKRA